mmetsp:Transcript_14842/g.62660  ORF Transcript_14842/g.62660 Transcript_14842/m.62660 type:complete len:213 (-) Transcript_14842:873-1511(-)
MRALLRRALLHPSASLPVANDTRGVRRASLPNVFFTPKNRRQSHSNPSGVLSGVGEPSVAIIPPVSASCDPGRDPNCERVLAERVSFGVTSKRAAAPVPAAGVLTGVALAVLAEAASLKRGGGAACLLRVFGAPFSVRRPGPARRMVDPGVPCTLLREPGVMGLISPRFIGVAIALAERLATPCSPRAYSSFASAPPLAPAASAAPSLSRPP